MAPLTAAQPAAGAGALPERPLRVQRAGVGGIRRYGIRENRPPRAGHARDGGVVADRRALDWRTRARSRGSRRVAVLPSGGEMGGVDVSGRESRDGAAGRTVNAAYLGVASLRGPSANVIVPSTTTFPSTRATPRKTPMRLRSR